MTCVISIQCIVRLLKLMPVVQIHYSSVGGISPLKVLFFYCF